MAYVYGHYKKDTGELFYVGKGTGKRAWTKRSRNQYWHRVVNKHGYVVKIIEDNLTDQEAFNKEIELIAEHKSSLVNLNEGGNGHTSESATDICNRPEVKKKLSDSVRKKWQDPEYRQKVLSTYTKDYYQRVKESNKRTWSDPTLLYKHSNRTKLLWENEEYRKKVSTQVKANRWKQEDRMTDEQKEQRKLQNAENARRRWETKTPEERKEHSRMMLEARLRKKSSSDHKP